MRRASGPIAGLTELPASSPGMRIGLFGGSFNPAHPGHRLVALEAIKRLDLDALWVLVSPGNPLKDNSALAPLPQRVQRARRVLAHPRVKVTGWEAAHGFRYTVDTLNALARRLPGRGLVWIMGGDSLADFHRWARWREIARLMPIAVYARPGRGKAALFSPAARALAPSRLAETDAPLLARSKPPAWVFLAGPLSSLSSSAIRAEQGGK